MNLPHNVTVQKVTAGVVDDRGVPAQVWSTRTANARAWVQPKSVREVQQLSQGGPVVSSHSIYLEPGTGIIEGDRITYGSNTYQVDGVKDEAGLGHHDKVDAHLVEVS